MTAVKFRQPTTTIGVDSLINSLPPGYDDDMIDVPPLTATSRPTYTTPTTTTTTISNNDEMSAYERTQHMLSTDGTFQKEIALGKRIGFYRLGKELGTGNFSKVKLGFHILTKEKVAIKVMEKAKMDQHSQRLLAREISNMEQLHHPNIIRLFECIDTLTKTHLIMEYAGGGELYVHVHEKGRLQEDEAKLIFAQIVSAIEHMHSKNVVHRDIKAENVMFSSPGWVKLGDFGFSATAEVDAQLTTFCGSPPYAAPELFRDKDYIGRLVDIWAMGILLYFMVVGITPFRGETVSELKQRVTAGYFTIPEYVSAQCQELINGTLKMDPTQRLSIVALRKSQWLDGCTFSQPYVANPTDDELKSNVLARSVRTRLQELGISNDMVRDAVDKGARNAIIGTYRIILYQAQSTDDDDERQRMVQREQSIGVTMINGGDGAIVDLKLRHKKELARLKYRSKTCTML